jgi:hypothetical protein
MSHVKATRVTIPEFEIYSNPTIRISEVKQRRFNVIDRHGDRPFDETIVISANGKIGPT